MSFEQIEAITLFGNPLIDFSDMGELLLRFAINLAFVFIIVRTIFYPLYRKQQLLFTYVLANLSIFLVCILLSSIKLKIGFAFGLFAVFSILRYRTSPIPIKEMTYLFVVIIVAVINALSIKNISYAEILFSNFAIAGVVYALELGILRPREMSKEIKYEKIELIKPEHYAEFIKDLKNRTGLDVLSAQVERINFLNDTARVNICYRLPSPKKRDT